MLRALGSRNYRLFFFGQVISLVGTWITTTATNWLVYRLTGSALLLGVVGFAGQFPAFLLGPFAGIAVDRWDRHRLLVVTQTISMLQSFGLAALVLSGRVTLEWIVGLSVLQGLVNAFDMPARQAFLLTMIENKADLGNAIALNSSMVNLARLIGPSIAGIVIASTGEGWCFLIDGVSYIAVIVGLLRMRDVRREATPPARGSTLRQFTEGFTYAFGFRPIRSIIILLALVSLVGVPYSVLMPVFATTVFHGGPHTLGILMTSSGCGALLGALWLAQRRSVIGLGRVISVAQRTVRRRADRLFVRSRPVARDSLPRLGGLRIHGADGVEQHRDSDDRGRRKARAGDELLRHGLPWHRAIRKPHRRLAVVTHWRGTHALCRRRVLCCGRALVCERAAGDSRRGATDLRQTGHPSRNGDGSRTRHRGVGSSRTRLTTGFVPPGGIKARVTGSR